jgi:hypothetical protein
MNGLRGRPWAGAGALMLRYWRRALRVRERIRLSEEALPLAVAGGVSVMGGLVTARVISGGACHRRHTLGRRFRPATANETAPGQPPLRQP